MKESQEPCGGFPFTLGFSMGGEIVKHYKTKSLRCLGIDPGIANTGIGIVGLKGTEYRLLHAECIETDKKKANPLRYKEIYSRVNDLIMMWDVELISVEQVFHNKNVSSSLTTAGVIGIMELLSARKELPCYTLRPQTVKQAVGCFGNADKKSVTIAVKRLLKTQFEILKNNHATDACACAVAGILEARSHLPT